MDNIATVDSGIERIVGLANKYWRHDGRTAFVFTADHGMTDWGSHGAGMREHASLLSFSFHNIFICLNLGMDHETQTPIVAWGAGIREARPFSPTSRTGRRANHPPTPSHWFLDHIDRSDASQADIAPLMSALLGANIPKHSAGQMPTDFLDLHISHKVQANLAVTKQMFEQFKVLSGSFQSAALSGFLHRPFPRLDEKRFQSELGKIDRHVNGARYTDGLRLTSDLYDVAAEGIDYYQKYYRRPLFAAISLSYIGFVVLLSTRLLINFTFLAQVEPLGGVVTLILNVTTLVTVVLVAISTLGQNVPLHFLCYYSAPVIVWHLTLRDVLRVRLANVQSGNRYLTVLKILFPLVVLELLVGAFFDRRVLSVAIFLVCLYQLVRISPSSQPLYLKVAWIFMNLVLAAFTFQPSVSKDRNSTLVLAAGFLASGVQAATSFAGRRQQAPESSLRATVSCCLFPAYLAVSGVCVAASANYTGLVDSSKVQMVSWTVFLSGLPLSLLLSRPNLLPRLSSLLGALLSSYILLSLSYEGLFLLALIGTLTIWLIMEYNESFKYQALAEMTISAGQRERNVIGFGDVTRALLFLYFSVVSFFGTGNIASLNSFDPRSIACLVSIFSPFLMGSLLLGKILIPFLLVALFMQAVKQVSGMASKALFLLLLLFSDVMSLHFFFCVTDQGSWQEIGTSLSHFVIAEGIVIFLLLFFVLAGFLLRFRLQSS